MSLVYYKERSGGDFLTIGTWSFNDDPVYAESTDIDPETGSPQTTGWGLNLNWREIADAITEIHTGLAFVEQASEPSGAGEPLQNHYGLWLSSVDDRLHFRSSTGDKQVAMLDDITGLDWQDNVIDKDLTAPPGSPGVGDRYIVATGATGAWSGHDDDIAEWNGSSWDFYTPNTGWVTFVADENLFYHFTTSWGPFGSFVAHNNLAGLQGGTTDEYYHLTSAQHTELSTFLADMLVAEELYLADDKAIYLGDVQDVKIHWDNAGGYGEIVADAFWVEESGFLRGFGYDATGVNVYRGNNYFALITAGTVINNLGNDYDTIIKGLTDDNLVFVNAGEDKVGIGRVPNGTDPKFVIQSSTEIPCAIYHDSSVASGVFVLANILETNGAKPTQIHFNHNTAVPAQYRAGEIEVNHDTALADTKSKMIFRVNDGSSVIDLLILNSSKEVIFEQGILTLKETTAPSNTANYGKVYSKTDKKLYYKDSSGNEKCISNGSVGYAFTETGQAYRSTNSVSYVCMGRFIYKGSNYFKPTIIKGIAWIDSATGNYSLRIQDITNTQTICSITGQTNTAIAIKNLGTISNLPTGEAIFEVQALVNNAARTVYVSNIELSC